MFKDNLILNNIFISKRLSYSLVFIYIIFFSFNDLVLSKSSKDILMTFKRYKVNK